MTEGSVKVNQADLRFAVGTAQVPGGWVGRIYVGGVEVWETPSPFSEQKQAHDHAVRHFVRSVSKAFGR